MKKLFAIAATVVLFATACSGSHSEKESNDTATEAAEHVKPSVEVLDDDTAYRPGIRPEMPTIIDFNATWCMPCKVFAPVFHSACEAFPNVKFVSADVDNMPLTAEAYGISSIPTVIFINTDGTETRYVGTGDLLPAERFNDLINEFTR